MGTDGRRLSPSFPPAKPFVHPLPLLRLTLEGQADILWWSLRECGSTVEFDMSDDGRTLREEFTKGILTENPIFVLLVGLCPVLATSTSVNNAVAMGLAATTVLICSNLIISLIRRSIPKEIRIPCFIVVIASFVTMVELWMRALFKPEVSDALGIFIPLIVVNCIILYRAEAFAYKSGVGRSVLDALGIGTGFTLALMLVALVRETLGNGTVCGLKICSGYEPASVMIMAPGAFLVLGLLLGFFNWIRLRRSA